MVRQAHHERVSRDLGKTLTGLMRTRFNLSLRGAQRRGNLDEAEHTSTNRRYYGDGIATLRSQ